MSAASAGLTRFKLLEGANYGPTFYSSRLLFGRYIPFVSFVIPGIEALWLVGSSLAVTGLSRQFARIPGPLPLGEAGVLAGIYLGAIFLMDLYDWDQIERRGEPKTNLIEAMGLVCVAISAAQSVLGLLMFSLWLLLLQVGLTIAFMLLARTVICPRVLNRRGRLLVGFIGGARARAAIEKERHALSRLGFEIELFGETVQQGARWFQQQLHGRALRHLIIDDFCLEKLEGYDFLAKCANEGIQIMSFDAFCERALGKVALGPHVICNLRIADRNAVNFAGDLLRRWRDILAAAVGLLIGLPVGILLAVAIKCDSAGPVFFTQERIGKNGRRFQMIKLRSMRQDMGVTDGPAWMTHERDPRITKVGAVMRLFHLDELPQLLNVLRGEMSLVGPRPFNAEHHAKLDTSPLFRLRLLVRPGITGWAQIRCHYAASVDDHEEVLSRDLFYIRHAGLLFDLFVIFDTLRICLWQKGAR